MHLGSPYLLHTVTLLIEGIVVLHVHIYTYVNLISVSWYFDLIDYWTKFQTPNLQGTGET